AAERATDAGIRQLLGDLAEEERKHEALAEEMETQRRISGAEDDEAATRHRLFVLQVIQPGLAGLVDGSGSTLAPLFAAAFASRSPGRPSWSAWPPASEPASAWVSPRRSPMMAASLAAAGHGFAAWSAD